MAELQTPATSSIPIKHAKILKGPLQMAFDITNRCNFKCLHCYNRSGEHDRIHDELKDKEVIKFIKDVVKIKPLNLCICGGEPLLREELVYEVAKILSRENIMVSLVTNGSLMTEDRAKRLLDSGIERIQVSLDGASAETHERLRGFKGSFKKVLDAISILKSINGSKTIVGVAFCPTRFNCHEFEKVFYMCKEREVDSIRIQPLMLLGRAQLNIRGIEPTPLQYRNLMRTINSLCYKYGSASIDWGDPIDHLIRNSSVAQHCVVFVHIFSNGDIAASPYLPIVVGNIKRYSFIKYWDAGLARMWESELLKKFANKIKSIPDLGKEHNGLPIVMFDEDIYVDLVDDNLFKVKESTVRSQNSGARREIQAGSLPGN
ncbi:MAG: radical SAM protein [bacterium]